MTTAKQVSKPPRTQGNHKPKIVATYDYTDEAGKLLYQVVRYEPKDFRQRRPDGKGGWIDNLQGTRRVLYRLPELCQAPLDRPVFLVEGEKDADNLHALGLLATTNAMGGAAKWRPEYTEVLRGRPVVLIPDNDNPGRKHVADVAGALEGMAASVSVLELPDLPPKGDVSDWLAAGGTKEELLTLAQRGEAWEPPADDGYQGNHTLDPGPDAPESQATPWPVPLSQAAYHGLAGDVVRTIEPYSEADPAALLVQTLIAYGSMVGRKAHFCAEDDSHYLNLFAVLVGKTSKGRKGSSWGRIRKVIEAVDSEWADKRVQSGLSSGEGLIWAVRDPIIGREKVKEKNRVTGYQEVETDPGVSDKRLLVYEPEFALVLKQIERQGNTLSAILRQAWDSGRLRTLTKNSPVQATGAHTSLIGHCTVDELRRNLSSTEAANGFGNRFLWVCSRRSRVLPEGSSIPPDAIADLQRRLSTAVVFARDIGTMRRDQEARELWGSVYEELSEGKPGMNGSLLARAEAQVMRLACLYALMDLSCNVERHHLEAALALWGYCEQSVKFVFGDSLGDPVADEIRRALQNNPKGMTRSSLRELFGRHRSSDEIGRALGCLLEYGLVRMEQNTTRGRPEERWFAQRKGLAGGAPKAP